MEKVDSLGRKTTIVESRTLGRPVSILDAAKGDDVAHLRALWSARHGRWTDGRCTCTHRDALGRVAETRRPRRGHVLQPMTASAESFSPRPTRSDASLRIRCAGTPALAPGSAWRQAPADSLDLGYSAARPRQAASADQPRRRQDLQPRPLGRPEHVARASRVRPSPAPRLTTPRAASRRSPTRRRPVRRPSSSRRTTMPTGTCSPRATAPRASLTGSSPRSTARAASRRRSWARSSPPSGATSPTSRA